MPITAIPSDAIKAIGSSQALSDAASVVKELLDNAIDGRATRIFIEMSANALDDIRVKDNGHGIAPEDRALICAKHCTSKIRDLHDLNTVGGRYLGFRGEALASAAEMSESLTITSRIEGEATAVELKFDRKGQILNEKRISHPVGTSVRVEKFLQHLPVRRQAAERMGAKMLAKIKRMLQAYSLARPHLHLSLKILKAKDRKGDWTYPKSGVLAASHSRTVFGAATDIFGAKLTSQCKSTFSSWSSTGDQIKEATGENLGPSKDETYTLEAILAKHDCEGSMLSNAGQYLSVDLRPVSCTRGTLKQIISSYKSHLRSITAKDNTAKIVDPFLCLNITCPPGSYDANVEPAKDDVLFINSELVLAIVERWFNNIYGEVRLDVFKPLTKNASVARPHGIELLLARPEAPVASPPVSISYVAEATRPQPQPAPKLTAQIHPPSIASTISTTRSSTVAPPRPNDTGVSTAISKSTADPPATELPHVEARPGFVLGPSNSVPSSTNENGLDSSGGAVLLEREPGWKGSMYADDDIDEADLEVHLQQRPRSPIEIEQDEDEHLRDVNVSNPWTFAKLNATMRPSGRDMQLHTPGRQIGDAGHSNEPSSDDRPEQVDSSWPENHLTRIRPLDSSPEAAYPTPSPFPFPLKARGKRTSIDASSDVPLTPLPSNKRCPKRGALDTWVQKPQGSHGELDYFPHTLHGNQNHPDLPSGRDFVSARSLPTDGIPLSEIPDSSQRRRRKPVPRQQQQGNINKPFIPPVHDHKLVWFDGRENSASKRLPNPRPNNNNHQDPATAPPTLILRDDHMEDDERVRSAFAERPIPPMHPDLAITLDYEARKQKANESHRKMLHEQAAAAKFASKDAIIQPHHHQSQPTKTTSSPHKNRQAKAIAALHNSAPNSSPTTAPCVVEAAKGKELVALDPSDPRAYLLRQQQQGNQTPDPLSTRATFKSRRQQTSMLPFETVAEQLYLGNLTLPMMTAATNMDTVENHFRKWVKWDQYVKSGTVGDAFGKKREGDALRELEENGEEERRWEMKLKELVGEMYAVEEGAGGSVGEGAGSGGERERMKATLRVDFSQMRRVRAAAGG